MESNLSLLYVFSELSNTSFENISSDAISELDTSDMDLIIEMFSDDQNMISEPVVSIIILCYMVLMVLAGI